ncbi:FAD-dependent oxidoreductase [Sphaerisporangium corydalis]|uniref:FAD-dependent oxidoreductase n=1 Tax=Sphaerisporangium corydalis TaxID=1441875 RepID=A0ABV9E5H7_9ACTN|nr:NAD(P)/FAD-dependent oxidoreductase [Sphaerisporangium corydalis]
MPRVIIVGGGLAGPCLAHGLRGAGFEVALHERDEGLSRGQGYRIHIDPVGTRALYECLPPHLYSMAIDTSCVAGTSVTMLSGSLDVVNRFVVNPDPGAPVTPDSDISVDRLTLRQILLAELGDAVRFGSEFTRFDLLPDGRVRAHFAGGASEDADILVAADGPSSRVRRQLLPDASVVRTGTWAVFGKTPLTPDAEAITPPAALDGFSAVIAPDGRFMPLAGHRFRKDPNSLASGLDFPDTRDYLMWVLAIQEDLSGLGPAALLDAVEDRISDWHPDLRRLVRLSDPETVRVTPLRTAEPVDPWPSGPVTFVGDAIHCMIPAGSGAGVALRDAGLLSTELGAALRDGSPLVEAIARYERQMLIYGFEAVAASLRPRF